MNTTTSEIARLRAELNSEASQLDETLDDLETRVKAENTQRVGKDRSWIARTIVITYGVAVIGVGLYIAFSLPSCPEGATECNPMQSWETQGKLMFDLIITAVVPIVTLMLGFYFGTEASQNTSGQ